MVILVFCFGFSMGVRNVFLIFYVLSFVYVVMYWVNVWCSVLLFLIIWLNIVWLFCFVFGCFRDCNNIWSDLVLILFIEFLSLWLCWCRVLVFLLLIVLVIFVKWLLSDLSIIFIMCFKSVLLLVNCCSVLFLFYMIDFDVFFLILGVLGIGVFVLFWLSYSDSLFIRILDLIGLVM